MEELTFKLERYMTPKFLQSLICNNDTNCNPYFQLNFAHVSFLPIFYTLTIFYPYKWKNARSNSEDTPILQLSCARKMIFPTLISKLWPDLHEPRIRFSTLVSSPRSAARFRRGSWDIRVVATAGVNFTP